MKIELDSTTKTVFLDSVECRVWEGRTASGIPVHAYIARISVMDGLPTEEFEAELRECRQPSAEVDQLPLRMIL